MIDNPNDVKLILEIKELVAGIDSVADEVNIYTDLIKQIILSDASTN